MGDLAPTVEASFFELQQDTACDLLQSGAPRVVLREASSFPYVVLDQSLFTMRCDGVTGFNRLLDAYFTGLEHRKRGSHSCFQISFARGGGRKRSYLRLIEMAWPRAQAAPGTGSNRPGSVGGGGAGKAAAALEQVLQSKLTGTVVASAYRASPLALVLKPCFEGASSLCFIHCMRLEQSQLPCLTASTPLLSKLFQWLGAERKSRGFNSTGSPQIPRRTPAVPPLALSGSTGGSCTLPTDVREAVTESSMSHLSAASSSSRSSNSQKKPKAAGAIPEEAGTGGDGGTGEASSVQANSEPLAAEQDSQVVDLVVDLMQVKRRTVEALEQDAKRSAAAFHELDALLGMIIALREANGGTGPDERETNLKLVYEQVYRSIQRSTEEANKIRHEIQELDSFCRKGYIPPVYDAYNASQQDIQKMRELHQATAPIEEKAAQEAANTWSAPVASQVIEIPHLPLSCLNQGNVEVPTRRHEEDVEYSSSSGSSSVPAALPPSRTEQRLGGMDSSGNRFVTMAPQAWAQALAPAGVPATMVTMPRTPPVPLAAGAATRLAGVASPALPYRPVSPPPAAAAPVREVAPCRTKAREAAPLPQPGVASRVGAARPVGTLTTVASESRLGVGVARPPQGSPPPRYRTTPGPRVPGGSMTVGPGSGGSLQLIPATAAQTTVQMGSPIAGIRTATPNRATMSPVLMTRTLSTTAVRNPPALKAPAPSPEISNRALAMHAPAPAAVLRGCRSAGELPRGAHTAWAAPAAAQSGS